MVLSVVSVVHVRWFGGSVSTSPATPAPRRNDQHHRGSPVAADEHTNPAKLPCRRAVGSSRQVAVIVPTGPRIEADAANFVLTRLA